MMCCDQQLLCVSVGLLTIAQGQEVARQQIVAFVWIRQIIYLLILEL